MDGELYQKEPWDRKCVKGKWRQANWAVYLRVGKFFFRFTHGITSYCLLQALEYLYPSNRADIGAVRRGNERKSTKFLMVLLNFSDLPLRSRD